MTGKGRKIGLILCILVSFLVVITLSSCGENEIEGESKCEHVVKILPAVSSTCTEKGLTEGFQCIKCNEIITPQYEILPLGHTEETVTKVEPTCTETGLTEGEKCSVCGEILVEQEVISAKGHSYGEWVTTTEPTCTEKGIQEKMCSICNDILTGEISPNGHAYEDTVTLPTCTEQGYTTHTCFCGDSYVDTYVKENGHSYGEWVTTKEPTCTEKGSQEKMCSICNDILTGEISPNGHAYEDTVTLPTCTEKGYTTHACFCGDSYIDTYVDANGHAEEIIEGVEPTCTETGLTEGKKCTVCGEILVEQVVISAKGHSYDDGVCLVCEELQSKGLEFTLNNETNTYTVKKGTCTDTEIIIPSKYNGLPVTNIGSSAFEGCTSLTRILIPNSVTKIGASAFSGCESLGAVYITDLTAWCNITFENGSANPLYYANLYEKNLYLNGELVTKLIIPDGVTSIGNWAFSGCTSLTSIVIPSSVTSIGKRAFYDCTSLEEICFNATAMNDLSLNDYVFLNAGKSGKGITVTIGSNVTKIPSNLFNPYDSSSYEPKITSVIFEEGSVCESIGECAFYNCAGLTSIEIPNSVTTIDTSAFNGCTGLTSIEIPNSVTTIGSYTFSNCISLTNVTIGDSVTSIGKCAFLECISLEEICFNATAMNDLNEYNYVFYNAGINGDGITVTIGSNVTKIPSHLFNPFSSVYEPKITNVIFEEGSVCESIGEYAFSGCTSLTSIEIPNSVTSIGEHAFGYCTGLESITIGDGVTSIGDWAFYDCTSLEEICFNATAMNDLSSNSYVFAYADESDNGITVTIGSNVTKIPSHLFNLYDSSSYAPKITSVIFEEGSVCESIGEYAFYGCTGLTSIEIPNSVTSIGNSVFFNCTGLTSATIGDSVTNIGSSAFYNCTSLQSIEIPNSVTEIGAWAFYSCTSLTSIEIPNSVTSIGNYAFDSCTALEEICFNATAMNDLNEYNYVFSNAGKSGKGITVTIGSNVTKIPSHLFNPFGSLEAPKITSVIFEEGSVCKSIGYAAFSGCTGLTSVTIGDGVTSIGEHAFRDCTSLKYNEYDNAYYVGNQENPYLVLIKAKDEAITSCEINGNTRLICSYAFEGCTSLTSIVIPNSVTSIDGCAFYGCTSLESATIGDSVTEIGSWAFNSCTSLTSVTIGNGVTEIDSWAFAGCTSLEAVYITDLTAWCNITFEDISANPLYYAKKLYLNGELVTKLVISEDVTNIKEHVFIGCTFIESIEVSDNNTAYKSIDGNLYTKDGKKLIRYAPGKKDNCFEILENVTQIGVGAFYGCENLTKIVIPDSVTEIGDYAFSGCTSLTDVTIGKGVKELSSYMFAGSESLVSIEIPNSVTSIEFAAFSGCTGLTSVVIPNSVTSIGEYAFRDCASLTSIVIPNSVTSIGRYAFDICTSLTIYAEAETQPSGWSSYWNSSNCPVYWHRENEPTGTGNYWHYDENGNIAIW